MYNLLVFGLALKDQLMDIFKMFHIIQKSLKIQSHVFLQRT